MHLPVTKAPKPKPPKNVKAQPVFKPTAPNTVIAQVVP